MEGVAWWGGTTNYYYVNGNGYCMSVSYTDAALIGTSDIRSGFTLLNAAEPILADF